MSIRTTFCIVGVACAVISFGQATSQVKLDNILMPGAVGSSVNMGHTNPSQKLNILIGLPFADPVGMQKFVDSVSNPDSPNFRKFISPEEVGSRFGLSDDKVQSVVNYLKGKGFTISSVGKSKLSIIAQCTVTQAESAFATQIYNFKSLDPNEPERKDFFSFTQSLQVPSTIAPYVQTVSGLQNYTKPHPRILTPTQERTLYGVAGFYNLGFQGSGRTVAISSWDGFKLTNVPLFYKAFGLPSPGGGVGSNITVITFNGGSGAGPAAGEADLDIQITLASAPLCNLRVYDGSSSSSNNLDVLQAEADDNKADIASESYGWDLSPTDAVAAHNIHLQMNAQGITYMAATGDSGTAGLAGRFQYSDYEPEVLLVGGTDVSVLGGGTRQSEKGWSDGGGGWTTNPAPFNVRPTWQKGTGVPGINSRLVPDVAEAASGPLGAVAIFYNGAEIGIDGTSVSSPMFAGQLAVAEQAAIAKGKMPTDKNGKQRVGRIQDMIYRQNGNSKMFFDVVEGGNGTLPNGAPSLAHAGWDTVTGWGAINWANIDLTPLITLPQSPLSISVVEGGGLNGFSWSIVADDNYFRIGASTIANLGQAASANYRFNLPGTVSRTWVQELDLTAISRFANGSTGQIYLFNYTTGKWDIVKSFPESTVKTSQTVAIKSGFTTYISAAGEYRILLRGLMPSAIGVTGSSFDTDFVGSSILYAIPAF
jgi:subtilase family serine protease